MNADLTLVRPFDIVPTGTPSMDTWLDAVRTVRRRDPPWIRDTLRS